MKIRTAMVAGLALAAIFFSLPAEAANGWVSSRVRMRAGPDVNYGVITLVPAGSDLIINGCVSGWGWCDVSWHGNRGWVSGKFLQANYHSRRAYIVQSGPVLNVPVVVYHDAHNYDRRDHWDDRRAGNWNHDNNHGNGHWDHNRHWND
jgi:uncharacterized protein YraI